MERDDGGSLRPPDLLFRTVAAVFCAVTMLLTTVAHVLIMVAAILIPVATSAAIASARPLPRFLLGVTDSLSIISPFLYNV
ncbi:hypothetical protein [Alicyclobacillus sacchari]|uniref:hypothetical protein n=1 Tax=Alicyclobacillus sacchari TaxID=392010 RepID=UPI0024E0F194|nr:hypothetical protein [Alicyclobacillus sacchari]